MLAISYKLESNLVTKRTHKKIMRSLNRQAMSRIRDNLPKHFDRNSKTNPGGEYGYEPRSKRWQILKAKKRGHQKPLVYTGRLKQSILSNVKISATASNGRIRTRGYFPMKTQMRREIETIPRSEQRELVARAGRDYVRYANKPENQRKRQRKG